MATGRITDELSATTIRKGYFALNDMLEFTEETPDVLSPLVSMADVAGIEPATSAMQSLPSS